MRTHPHTSRTKGNSMKLICVWRLQPPLKMNCKYTFACLSLTDPALEQYSAAEGRKMLHRQMSWSETGTGFFHLAIINMKPIFIISPVSRPEPVTLEFTDSMVFKSVAHFHTLTWLGGRRAEIMHPLVIIETWLHPETQNQLFTVKLWVRSRSRLHPWDISLSTVISRSTCGYIGWWLRNIHLRKLTLKQGSAVMVP